MLFMPEMVANIPWHGVHYRTVTHDESMKCNPQTCFARCDGSRLHYGFLPPPPPWWWSPYGKLWYSRTPGVLLLLCCSRTRFVHIGTLSLAVITWGCHNDNEALPLHLHAGGLHTVSCGTLAHLVCCCCCAVPVLVLFIAARFHSRW